MLIGGQSAGNSPVKIATPVTPEAVEGAEGLLEGAEGDIRKRS